MCTYRSLFLLTPISPLALHVRGAPTKEVLHETQVLHGSQAIELMSLLKTSWEHVIDAAFEYGFSAQEFDYNYALSRS